jgi:hypothetical protein
MTRAINRHVRMALAIAAGAAALFVNDNAGPRTSASLISQAEAVIGRPLTPMSYAGVARRTTRRVEYGAAAAGAAAYGAAAYGAYGAGCVQAVDAYGRVYTRC